MISKMNEFNSKFGPLKSLRKGIAVCQSVVPASLINALSWTLYLICSVDCTHLLGFISYRCIILGLCTFMLNPMGISVRGRRIINLLPSESQSQIYFSISRHLPKFKDVGTLVAYLGCMWPSACAMFARRFCFLNPCSLEGSDRRIIGSQDE